MAKADSAIPRFASEAFALREIPNGLLSSLEAEYKGMHFEEISEEPVYSQEYDAMEVGGITAKAGHKPSIGHCRISEKLYEQFYQALTPLIEEWCGSPLERAYGYGIRSYGEGSILLLHRDKIESHVISCIVHVDDVEAMLPKPGTDDGLPEVVRGDLCHSDSSHTRQRLGTSR